MLELLLYSTLTCSQTDAIMLRIAKHKTLKPEIQMELIETVKDSNPECYWDENG